MYDRTPLSTGTRGGPLKAGGHFPVFDRLFKKRYRDLSTFIF
jgi:hypothetical protein